MPASISRGTPSPSSINLSTSNPPNRSMRTPNDETASRQPLLQAPAQEVPFTLVRLFPSGQKTVDGLAMSYENEFPRELVGIVPDQEFKIAMNAINQVAADYFPCCCCRLVCGLLCIFSAGTSLCCIRPCTGEMKQNIDKIIERINHRQLFSYKGIRWELKHEHFESWIEITQVHAA